MSRDDTCLRCGQQGHTASSCKRPVGPPELKVEPFDATDRGMHRCSDCARRLGYPQRIPSITQPVRCASFRPRTSS